MFDFKNTAHSRNTGLPLPVNASLIIGSNRSIGTFHRTTTKTYMDNNGILQTAAINEPTFDNTYGLKGLMLNQSSTNLNYPSNSIVNLQAIDNVAGEASIVSGQN